MNTTPVGSTPGAGLTTAPVSVSRPAADPKDTVEISGGATLLKGLGYAGSLGWKAISGVAVGGARAVAGFCKGVARAQDGVLGEKAGLLGISAIPAGVLAATAGIAMTGLPAVAVVAGVAGMFWYHTGAGLIGAAREVVSPGS